jgi:putative AdoMet-dependent methyltransferase
VQLASPKQGMHILDLGIGTGALSSKFSSQGCAIWGIDYSSRMLGKAREKVPQANLMQADIQGDWSSKLDTKFDRVVTAYTMHHFNLAEKRRILKLIIDCLLRPEGLILVGDISFRTQADLDKNKSEWTIEWDESEYYWVADSFAQAMAKSGTGVTYEQVSFCAGIYVITPTP